MTILTRPTRIAPVGCIGNGGQIFRRDLQRGEGRAIARALKAALPPGWTVAYEDADAWLRPKDLPAAARQLILPAEPLRKDSP